MAHVEKRGPGQWVAIYANPGNKSGRGAKTFGRRVDAERFLAVTLTAQLKREWIDPSAGRVTVHTYASEWIKHRAIRETTRIRYYSYLRYIDRLGDYPLDALTPTMLERWQTSVRADQGDTTTRSARNTFAAILNSAVRDRLLSVSPLQGVPASSVARRLVQPLPLATVLAIRDSIQPRYRAAVLVGAQCGLRRGETMGLTPDRVDLLRGIITVDRQLVQLASHRPIFGPPKTASSTRQVPMPRAVVDALAAHLVAYPVGVDGLDALIFRGARGAPIYQVGFGQVWTAASGSPTGSRFHDLRHFYASTLIAAGASVKEVQARLGHARASETLDTYSHLWPNSEDNTRRILDGVFDDEGV